MRMKFLLRNWPRGRLHLRINYIRVDAELILPWQLIFQSTAAIHPSLITRSPSPRGYLCIHPELYAVAFHRQSTVHLPCELMPNWPHIHPSLTTRSQSPRSYLHIFNRYHELGVVAFHRQSTVVRFTYPANWCQVDSSSIHEGSTTQTQTKQKSGRWGRERVLKILLLSWPRKRKPKVDSCNPEELFLGSSGLGNVLWYNHHPCSGEKSAEKLMYLQVIGKHKDHYSDGDEY